jgi:hypothetical protein
MTRPTLVQSLVPRLGGTHGTLAILRVLYHATVFWLLYDLWLWRGSAFLAHPREGMLLLLLGLLTNAFLIVGFFTRPLLIVNVVLLRVLFFFCQDPYTVDDVVQYFSFVFAFGPEPRAYSLDSARRGRSDPGDPLPFGFVLFAYVILVLLYWDSVYYKLHARIWQTGSAFWLGAALPFMGQLASLPRWAEEVHLLKALTWGALAYEMAFPLIVVPVLRKPLLCIGVLVHAGSGIFFPLPQFALVMLAMLALFMREPGSGLAPPAEPAPWAAGRLGYALIALTVASQFWLHLEPGPNLVSRVVGTQTWPIFIDWHFTLPAPLYRLTLLAPGGEVPIPSFDAAGRPTTRDRYWKVLGFSLRGSSYPWPLIGRYVHGFFQKEGRAPAPVRVDCKDVRLPTLEISFTLPEELRLRPWRTCGLLR